MVAGSRRGRRAGRVERRTARVAYKQRNTVERRTNRLQQWRGLATRFDKNATIYRAGPVIAAIHMWAAR